MKKRGKQGVLRNRDTWIIVLLFILILILLFGIMGHQKVIREELKCVLDLGYLCFKWEFLLGLI